MPKLETFAFRLNNAGHVYAPGDILNGSVIVVLREAMKMRGLSVTFIGKAFVHVAGRHSESSLDKQTDYRRTAEEYYFTQKVVLWGKDSSSNFSEHMPAGRQEFLFSFRLPVGIPSSFEGRWGYVRYMIKGTINKPWKFDHHTKTAFTVISPYDLNMDPAAQGVIMHQGESDTGCWCSAQEKCSIVFRIDQRGYVPGEVVTVTADVGNQSSSNWCLEFKLKMVATFHVASGNRCSETEIVKKERPNIPAHTNDVWLEKVRLPSLPSSHLHGCNIIDIDYIVRFKATNNSCSADDLEYHNEILIGTIPLQRPVANVSLPQPFSYPSAPPRMLDAIPMGAIAASQPSAPPLSSEDLPPPSYEECMFGRVNIRDDDDNEYTAGELSFVPTYPYYNFDQYLGPSPPGQNPPPSSQNINRI